MYVFRRYLYSIYWNWKYLTINIMKLDALDHSISTKSSFNEISWQDLDISLANGLV